MECELITVVDHIGGMILAGLCLYGLYKFIMANI